MMAGVVELIKNVEDIKMFTEEDIVNVISVYEECGIVTRNDCANIDSRPLSQEIFDEIQKRGHEEALMIEAHLEGYMDYSRAIFNPDEFKPQEAKTYLIKNVLHP